MIGTEKRLLIRDKEATSGWGFCLVSRVLAVCFVLKLNLNAFSDIVYL